MWFHLSCLSNAAEAALASADNEVELATATTRYNEVEALTLAAHSDKVAGDIDDYFEEISYGEGSILDLSDEGLSIWTTDLRDAVLNQLSIHIDTDYPINTVDLSGNNFDETETAKAENDIMSDFNKGRKPKHLMLCQGGAAAQQQPRQSRGILTTPALGVVTSASRGLWRLLL